jgi:pentatricopeptide repeat protein
MAMVACRGAALILNGRHECCRVCNIAQLPGEENDLHGPACLPPFKSFCSGMVPDVQPSCWTALAPCRSLCLLRLLLPGLTKILSKLSKEGCWRKALEVYESVEELGLAPDTALTNAAISACDKGGRWQKVGLGGGAGVGGKGVGYNSQGREGWEVGAAVVGLAGPQSATSHLPPPTEHDFARSQLLPVMHLRFAPCPASKDPWCLSPSPV